MARVLIVLDGSYRFTAAGNPPDADFTYTSLVGALESANHNVTKAHRQNDSSAASNRLTSTTPASICSSLTCYG